MCICNEPEVKCFPRRLDHFKNGEVKLSRPFFPPPNTGGDEEKLTDSFFTLISEDREKEWLPSVVLRADKDFSAVVPTTRDKCLTEGYSPSCGS